MADEKQAKAGQQPTEQKVRVTGPQLMQLAAQERQKLEQVNAQINSLQGFRNELAGARETLKEFGENEKGGKIMVNLGAGIYIEASVDDTAKSHAAIAGSVFKEKKNTDLIRMLDERIATVDKQLEQVSTELQNVVVRVNQLESLLQAGQQYLMQQQAANTQQIK